MALNEFMNILRQAARELRVLTMDYYSDAKMEETFGRRIEPYEVRGDDFFAYDIAKGGIRKFKHEGVLNLQLTNQHFTPRWPVKI